MRRRYSTRTAKIVIVGGILASSLMLAACVTLSPGPAPLDPSALELVHDRRYLAFLETLWTRNVTITTGLVDTYTIPQLLGLVSSGRLDPTAFATHRFALGDTMDAYDTFADAANTNALKVVLEAGKSEVGSAERVMAGAVA